MKPDGRRALEIAQASARAVDRHFESRADGANPRLGESTKSIHQHPDRDAFDCVRARVAFAITLLAIAVYSIPISFASP